MGRYLELLEEARAKRAKEGMTKGTPEGTPKATRQYNDTPLVVSVVSVVGGQASTEAKLGQELRSDPKSEKGKKIIKSMTISPVQVMRLHFLLGALGRLTT